jgi:hypothetical protein
MRGGKHDELCLSDAVSFCACPCFRHAAPAARAVLAQQLAALLDASPEGYLRGAAIVLGDRYGVHPGTGAVFLDCAGAAAGAWPERLLTLDVAAVQAAVSAARRRKEAEAALATRMGVALIAAEDALGRSAAYTAFLARLGDTAAARGAAAGGALTQVPVRVSPAPEAPPERSSGSGDGMGTSGRSGAASAAPPGFEYVAREALLAVPITAAGDDVYAFLAHAGPAAAAARAAAARAERAAADAALAARRALRLRHLVRADGVSHEAFGAACARLLRHRNALAPHAEGVSMRVVPPGAHPALSPDAAYLDVPADFVMTASERAP